MADLTLRQQTKDYHDLVEHSEFSEILLSGEISPELYQEYLHAQFSIYSLLESGLNLPEHLQEVYRSSYILHDLEDLESEYELEELTEHLTSVEQYLDYIQDLIDNEQQDKLFAHMYVRHFGDLHGGQIIKKKVPYSGTMYEFDNRKELIQGLRELLNNDMGEEANVCFKFVLQMFEELAELYEMKEIDDIFEEYDDE